jgi:hypothetical protein
MATYKGIKGFSIQNLSADPSNPIEGEMWYNSTSNVWKESTLTTAGTWATSGNLNTARSQGAAAGTTSAALYFGGSTDNVNTVGATESYNGTSWTTVTGLNAGDRLLMGSGSQTSALRIGGLLPPPNAGTNAVESWNGTSWTGGTNYPSPIHQGAATGGSNTAIMVVGGEIPARTTNVFSYNGTSWTSLNPVSGNAVSNQAVCGTLAGALSISGNAPGPTSATQSYDGTSWATVAPVNTTRTNLGAGGTQTLAVAFGGTPPITGATELWDGTSWTNNPNNMGTAVSNFGYDGSQTSALAVGGNVPPVSAVTQEFTGAGVAVTKTITVS